MELKCDVCGGGLQMNAGGHSATCVVCGMGYTVERLREKLNGQNAHDDRTARIVPPIYIPQVDNDEDNTEVETEVKIKQDPWTAFPLDSKLISHRGGTRFDYRPQQFVMENNTVGKGDICGMVRHGGIGLGDYVFIDGDYKRAYKICQIISGTDVPCVKAGAKAELYLEKCPWSVRKNARMVVGVPNPMTNYYNYVGTVKEYFTNLLAGEFSQYDIYTDVKRDEAKIPVNYMFFLNKKPVLAVFLLESNERSVLTEINRAARSFAFNGISCIHFYTNFRNDMPYIVQRISGALGRGHHN